MNNERNSEITYVLFGKEAILTYKLSAETLLKNNDIKYKVGAYTSVRSFVNETQKWDGFIEITREDYEILKSKEENIKRKKKPFYKMLCR